MISRICASAWANRVCRSVFMFYIIAVSETKAIKSEVVSPKSEVLLPAAPKGAGEMPCQNARALWRGWERVMQQPYSEMHPTSDCGLRTSDCGLQTSPLLSFAACTRWLLVLAHSHFTHIPCSLILESLPRSS